MSQTESKPAASAASVRSRIVVERHPELGRKTPNTR